MQKRFLNCGKSIVSEQLANTYKVGRRTQVWFTDAVVIAGLEPSDPNGPFQFWTPAVLPVLGFSSVSLSSLAEASRRAAFFAAPATWDGSLASLLPRMQHACKLEIKKTTALYYSKIIKMGKDIDRNKNSIYNDIS